MKTIIMSIICMLFISVTSAQEFRLAGIDYFSYAKAPLKNAPASGDISFREIAAFANFPTLLKNQKTILINGFRYTWVQPTLSAANSTNHNTTNFHSFCYSLRLIHTLKNNWTAGLALMPTLAGDFKSPPGTSDFVMQGAITFIKKTNENTHIGTGLTYTTTLGIPVPLPMVILLYNNNRHRINIYLPSIADYTYALDEAKRWKAGFRIALNGAQFNYSNNAAIPGEPAADKINYSRANTGPTVSYKPGKYLQIEAFGGINAMRRYRYEDVNGNSNKFDSKASGFFNFGITLTPPENPKFKSSR